MQKIMEVIAKETSGKSYSTYKYSFDSIGLPNIDYDNDTQKTIQWQQKGETVKHINYINLKKIADKIIRNSILTYFLDGSRRVFKVDDVSYNNHVFPVIAGQIGVGCCKRENKKMKSELYKNEIVIALPDKSNTDGWNDDAHLSAIKTKLNKEISNNRYKFEISKILHYKTSQSNELENKFEDRGIAIIQDYMIEKEKEFVFDLVKENKLNQDNYLLKDDSLEYKVMKSGNEDFRELLKIKNNYKWVVGVSKSFNPESCKDYKGKHNSDYIADLPIYNRTPVARFKNPDFLGDVEFAVWYLRLRDKKRTKTPFDGVLKIEKILMDYEIENGVDSDEVDLISTNIINERTPTCYGLDKRWANHLYPVFLTESFIKSKYISTEMFLNLF